MLRLIKRIRAKRQFRRFVSAGFSEPLLDAEIARLGDSWNQMQTESHSIVAPGAVKYGFGWAFEPKQMPAMPAATRKNSDENRVGDAPHSSGGERVYYQKSNQTPIDAGTTEKPQWFIAFTRQFRKDIDGMDRKLQGKLLEAISEICQAPVTPKGDTVKPLGGDLAQLWRYRIGDFRLIYHPDATAQTVSLLQFASRGSVYQ